MGQFLPGMFPGVAVWSRAGKLAGYHLPPALAWYMPGVQSPSQLAGLGAGAASGRFNRSVSRGVYQLPFVEANAQGHSALGQLPGGMTLVYLGIAALGLGMLFMGGRRRIRRHHHRRPRLVGA
jgi:hypothetical protein